MDTLKLYNMTVSLNQSTDFCAQNDLVKDNIMVFLGKSQTTDVLCMTAFLAVVGLLGGLGNITVILVCWKHPSRQSTQHFILAMAICDLFVCVTVIPYRVLSYHLLLTEGACKFFEALTYHSVLFSMFLLIAVAVDRYHAVCRPITYHKLSSANGNIIIALSIITLAISIYAGLIAGHYVNINYPNDGNETMQCFTGICNEDGQDRRFSTKSTISLYSFFLGFVYVSLVVIVVAVYSRVFSVLYSRYAPPNSQTRPRPSVAHFETSVLMTNASEGETLTILGGTASKGKRRASAGSRVSHRRTAKILLLVTVAFILTWIPFVLMKTKLVPNVVTVRLSFFISNMINPIIYSFTNQQFRENVLTVLGREKAYTI